MTKTEVGHLLGGTGDGVERSGETERKRISGVIKAEADCCAGSASALAEMSLRRRRLWEESTAIHESWKRGEGDEEGEEHAQCEGTENRQGREAGLEELRGEKGWKTGMRMAGERWEGEGGQGGGENRRRRAGGDKWGDSSDAKERDERMDTAARVSERCRWMRCEGVSRDRQRRLHG